MTIKRIQTFHLPFIGKVGRVAVLKPGFIQKIRYNRWNEDRKEADTGVMRLRVVSQDAVEILGLNQHISAPVYLEKGNIKFIVDKEYGGKAWGPFGEEVDIVWEPTLPSQARK